MEARVPPILTRLHFHQSMPFLSFLRSSRAEPSHQRLARPPSLSIPSPAATWGHFSFFTSPISYSLFRTYPLRKLSPCRKLLPVVAAVNCYLMLLFSLSNSWDEWSMLTFSRDILQSGEKSDIRLCLYCLGKVTPGESVVFSFPAKS